MKISKILSYVVLAVGAIGIILWFLMNSSVSTLIEENGVSEARELPLDVASSAVSPLYSLTLLIFIIAIVITIFAVIVTLLKNPSSLKITAIGFGAFLLIFLVAYVLSSGVETPLKDGGVLSASKAGLVEAGIITFYILAFVAVALMLVSGVRKLIS